MVRGYFEWLKQMRLLECRIWELLVLPALHGEMSAAGDNVGMDIDLSKVPTRQDNMKDWENLLSESQGKNVGSD